MAKNELIEAGKEISIDALDTAISNLTDFFKGFPVISSAITLLKALASIPDRLYVKKMYYFLSALKNDDMDSDTFSDAMNKLNKDETKFEETLLFIIEKAFKPRPFMKETKKSLKSSNNREVPYFGIFYQITCFGRYRLR